VSTISFSKDTLHHGASKYAMFMNLVTADILVTHAEINHLLEEFSDVCQKQIIPVLQIGVHFSSLVMWISYCTS